MSNKCTCSKCKKTMVDTNFYTYKNGQKCELCKNCLTMHVDNYDPQTFIWLLEKFDVPYIPAEWDVILAKAALKDPSKITGTSVFGKYLSKMKLKQWKDYTWADTERIAKETKIKQNEAQKKLERSKEDLKEMLESGEINQTEYKTYMSTYDLHDEQRAQAIVAASRGDSVDAPAPFEEVDEIPEPEIDLTLEDKKYLMFKWGRDYTPQEWVQLEQKYNEMMNSFEIIDSDSISSLILICKTYLKLSNALDAGDFDAYQKLTRVYNDLRKTSNFTASQNKKEEQKEFDSVGKIVRWCELHGGQIPKWEVDVPLDVIDVLINDLKNYTKSLFMEDPTMSDALFTFIKKKEDIKVNKKLKEAGLKNEREIVLPPAKDIVLDTDDDIDIDFGNLSLDNQEKVYEV